MVKFNISYFYNLSIFLLLLILFGCGYTPIIVNNKVEIINGNSTTSTVSKFNVTPITKTDKFDNFPKSFLYYKNQIDVFDFYLAESPTQGTSGYTFTIIEGSYPVKICLMTPAPFDIVATVLTNPVGLIKAPKGTKIQMAIDYCK